MEKGDESYLQNARYYNGDSAFVILCRLHIVIYFIGKETEVQRD